MRRAALTRAAWGGVLLIGPRVVLAATGCPQAPCAGRARTVLRILGARHLAQAALEMRRPTAGVFTFGAVTDALHAGSAIALAALSGTWRRAALVDTTVAAGFSRTTFQAARQHSSRHRLRSRP